MPRIQQVVYHEIDSLKFLRACNDIELWEVNMYLNKPEFVERINRTQDIKYSEESNELEEHFASYDDLTEAGL